MAARSCRRAFSRWTRSLRHELRYFRMRHISIVDSRSLRDQVQGALEAALIAGELVPGELYSAPMLGERFGVSATPVREAMLALVNDGFVIAERKRGFRVVEVSETDLDEICQIRLMLEVPATVEVSSSSPSPRVKSRSATTEPFGRRR